MNNPLVSVCCLTYNHKDYIRKCIEGFLIQNVNFDIEFLIHDDASKDETQNIIKDLVGDDPRFILFFREVNIMSSGKKLLPHIFEKARGKYIAICEGDDYWIDPYKLQKQYDFLEQNTDCSLCFHSCYYLLNNNVLKISKPNFVPINYRYNIEYIFSNEGGSIATHSIFFLKKYTDNLPNWYFKSSVGDLPLFLLLASNGKIGYIDEIMGVYRFMSNNSWSEKFSKNLKFRIQNYISIINMYYSFNYYTKFHYFNLIFKNIFLCYLRILGMSLMSLVKHFKRS